MTSHFLDDVLNARPSRPVPSAHPVAVQGVRAIPRSCSCTWKPDYATLPATWTLAKAEPQCKAHRPSVAAEGNGGRA